MAELQVLRKEEATRFQAYVPKPPRDSKFGGMKVCGGLPAAAEAGRSSASLSMAIAPCI